MDVYQAVIYSEQLTRAVAHLECEEYYFQENLLEPEDVFLASFPRSGNHFVRFIILSAVNYLRNGFFPTDFSGMRGIPDIHDFDLSGACTRPRIIKTHYPYDHRYRNVIHLVRDPRDLLVSYYHYTSFFPHLYFNRNLTTPTMDEFIKQFLDGNVWPCDLRFHSRSFSGVADKVRYICICYENFLENPLLEIGRLLGFLNMDLGSKVMERLAKHTLFHNMKGMHDRDSAREGGVFLNREFMLRQGISGGYRQVFNDSQLARIDSEFAEYRGIYGYS